MVDDWNTVMIMQTTCTYDEFLLLLVTASSSMSCAQRQMLKQTALEN